MEQRRRARADSVDAVKPLLHVICVTLRLRLSHELPDYNSLSPVVIGNFAACRPGSSPPTKPRMSA